ncbi:MAG TPA: penicillin-binding protein 1B [Pseudomonas xinjiangensis]|uniref:Penicillin-binding protein 1B n=2 Tax=root TaxID=1 RepID=A0A7V1FQW2_9GAMM|nr:penicillin-binding protein 1B [Halopseudomonas xinjiangensis]HEC46448.1 penicillin-binding protein 1B [Halopseudomonas xinjiangensis]
MGRKRRGRTAKKAGFWKRSSGWLFKLALVGLVVFAGLVIYLDAVVQEKFSGKRWAVPAKVFARPLELYAGQRLTKDDFLTELGALGYRNSESARVPGLVAVSGNRVDVHTRGFQFPEGVEPAQKVSVRFEGPQISAFSGAGDLVMARLEPLLIGGIYPAHNEDRVLIQLDQAPPYLVESLVAVEDREFFNHFGVSPKGILRAAYVNFTAGSVVQGGSTLTQQLVKNFYLTSDRSLIRKGTEAIMAVLLELHYPKEEILEAYLNEVFLGQDGQRAVHGFGLASQYYFAQPLRELQLHQVALLVGMVKGPSFYNPRRHPERSKARRDLVIQMMAEQGMISESIAQQAQARDLDVAARGRLADTNYPAFMDLIKRQLRDEYREEDLTSEGLRIFTSLDPLLQRKAERAVEGTLKRLGPAPGDVEMESAMVVTSAQTGEVLALVGGRNPQFSGFNRALDATRPIGSLIKPAIYLTALEQPQKYSLITPIDDSPITLDAEPGRTWTPQNYDRESHGLVPLHQALSRSYNQATVRLGMELGVPQVLKTVERMGVQHGWRPYPSMLLGSGAMTPLQVTDMYQTLANGGFNTPLRAIRSVLATDGEPLGRYPFAVQQRFDSATIYLMQEAMSRTMTEGTGRSAYNQISPTIRLAGKTGTTNDLRDSWFAGFSEDLLAVSWLGRDDNGQTRLTGATGALQVWAAFMREAHPVGLSPAPPESIQMAWIDVVTGLGSDPSCPDSVQVPFRTGYAPLPGPGCRPIINTEAVKEGASRVMDVIRDWLP